METLLLLLLLGFGLYLLTRSNSLSDEVRELRLRVDKLTDALNKLTAGAPKAEPPPAAKPQPIASTPPRPEPRPAVPPPAAARIPEPLPPVRPGEWRPARPVVETAKAVPPPQKKKPTISWEQQIGARLPVWIGGIALALSGIFLVKYSIDTGLLNPAVRCALAGLLGAALIGGAQWISAKQTIANGERIAQAMSGSGIAVLYGALFAAGTVYAFFSPAVTFAGMALVTALAVILSLRQGAPIAMLGMVGGFLTPMLVGSSEPNAAVLFGYLIALNIGLFFVIRRQNWWRLAWPIVIASYAWVLIWLANNNVSGDGLWLGVFLLAQNAVTFTFLQPSNGRDQAPYAWPGLIVTAAAAVLLMSVIVVRSSFGATEWALYGALSIGALALGIRDEERFRFVPWMAMAAAATLLAVWVTPNIEFLIAVLASFAVLFAAAGIVMIWRSRFVIEWGGLACAAMLLFFVIAFARLDEVVQAARAFAPATAIGSLPIWGIVALFAATVATLVAGRIVETKRTANPLLLPQFALTAITFVALALVIEIPLDYLPVAFAGLTLAVAWIDARTDVPALRLAVTMLGAAFVLLMLPQLNAPFVYAARVIAGAPLGAVGTTPLVESPLFYLGVPALLFAAASYFLHKRADDGVVAAHEMMAAILVAIMGYFLIRLIATPAAQILATVTPVGEGAIISQALIVYAIVLAAAGATFARAGVLNAAAVMAVVAIARIIFFDAKILLLIGVAIQFTVGSAVDPSLALPAASAPLFHLALPAVLLAILAYVARDTRAWLARVCEYTVVAFAGLMTYYLIRHAFNAPENVFAGAGTYLERGVLTNAFILVGAAAYLAGARWNRTAMRIGGVIAAALGALRLGFFDILVSSPLVAAHDVGSWPVLNALLLPYGMPIAWLALSGIALARRNLSQFVPYVHAAALLLLFALVSLNVRQIFQGPVLNASGPIGDNEVYAYSIAWLLLGIGLLVAGTVRKDKVIRFASLAVMVLTVGKVFLYDASELTGLLRVVSFLGLGLSLLGLSWFYTRYVFASAPEEKPA